MKGDLLPRGQMFEGTFQLGKTKVRETNKNINHCRSHIGYGDFFIE